MRKLFYLLSAVFGGFVALLLAPRKGKDFRSKIKKSLKDESWDPLKEEAKLVGKEIGEVVDEIKSSEEIQSAVKKGKTKLQKILSDAQKDIKTAGDRAYKKVSKKAKNLEKKVAKKTKEVSKTAKRIKRKVTK